MRYPAPPYQDGLGTRAYRERGSKGKGLFNWIDVYDIQVFRDIEADLDTVTIKILCKDHHLFQNASNLSFLNPPMVYDCFVIKNRKESV